MLNREPRMTYSFSLKSSSR